MESSMQDIFSKVSKLREILIDKYAELKNIYDDLLILALTRSVTNELSNSFISQQKILYGSENNQRLEFLGDAILELIVSDLLFNNFIITSPGELTSIRSKLVRNVSLACFMNNKQLCELIISPHPIFSNTKYCADLFESIVGAIYYYLKISHPNPF